MECPLCHVNLQLSVRQGVEIDYCPKCRGIWLDRGELEKLIDFSVQSQLPPKRTQYEYDDSHEDHYNHRRDRPPYSNDRPQKKKESWLAELFDFD